MSQFFKIPPDDPEERLLRAAAAIIRQGGVVVYPTDSGYALGCRLDDRQAMIRIRKMRDLDENHNFTLVLQDLTELPIYAEVSDTGYALMRECVPGPYTFLLKATHEVPRRLQHPNRKTIGIRVPDHKTAQALLEVLGEPVMSTTMILPGEKVPMIEPQAIREIWGRNVDLVIDGGYCGVEPTTMIDLLEDKPKIIRKGKGDIRPFE